MYAYKKHHCSCYYCVPHQSSITEKHNWIQCIVLIVVVVDAVATVVGEVTTAVVVVA